MTQALIKNFDTWGHFDSDIANEIIFPFNAKVGYCARVSYIIFQMEDDINDAPQTFTDFTAFLEVQIQNAATTNIILQGTKTIRHPLLPIRNPHLTTPVIDAYFFGTQEGAQTVTFAIKDKNLQIVPTKRLVLTFRLTQDV
ncbi:MAG: hypothetical protein ACMG6E_01895 [Candidatus Roizmanbacteria bacterium]